MKRNCGTGDSLPQRRVALPFAIRNYRIIISVSFSLLFLYLLTCVNSLDSMAIRLGLYSYLMMASILSKWRQTITRQSINMATCSMPSSVSESFSQASRATMINLPIAGRSSSGSRPKWGPLSGWTSCHSGQSSD